MFIQSLFNLPEWVLYVEIAVYSVIVVFGIIPRLFRLRRNFKKMGPAFPVYEVNDEYQHEDFELYDDEILIFNDFYANDPEALKKATKEIIKDILAYNDLLTKTVNELRPIARDLKVKNWWNIKKETLIEKITAKQNESTD